jgi:type III secretion system low calcium response chaperone LcrH/SycD
MAAEDNSQEQARLTAMLQRWADGKATLRDVRGYTNEELYSLARTAYFYFYQGRIAEARILVQGLYAINPADPYFAKALGVVELAAGNGTNALAAFDVAVKLSPQDPSVYVGRAEVRLSLGQRPQALEDLRRAAALGPPEDPQVRKAQALLANLLRR